MKKQILLACALAMAGVSGGAMAVEAGDGFIGADIGYGSIDVDVDGIGSESDDDRTLGARAGYYFTPYFGVEGFYSNLYDYSEDGYSADLDGWGLGLVARRNFGVDGNGFFVAGRAGVFRADGEAAIEDLGSISGNSTDPYFGVGVGYDFTDNVGMSLDYTWYSADFDDLSVDVQTLTAGLQIRF